MAREPVDAKVVGAEVEFHPRSFLTPLQMSSGDITRITEASVAVRVRVAGRDAVGRGSVYLSALWAWREAPISLEEREHALRSLCREIAGGLAEMTGPAAHPLELGLRLHERVLSLPGTAPALARLMCASPFDAAVHDAVGIALARSAFDLYDEPVPVPHADRFFGGPGDASREVSRLIRPAIRELDGWLVVGRSDPLEDLRRWTSGRGYHAFKIKTLGTDSRDDAERTAAVYRTARSLGVEHPRITADSNEANPDAASVLDYLRRLEARDSGAYAALEYLEQPTHRDILRYPHDWREVTARRPVLLDEGFSSMELLPAAVAQGWSGLALKTCKGHSFLLVAAAWARARGMKVTLQDLTNPGFSAIHAALFASRIATVNGVELNSPQYTPSANAAWLPRLASLFEPTDGVHRLPDTPPVGLGTLL